MFNKNTKNEFSSYVSNTESEIKKMKWSIGTKKKKNATCII